MIVLLILLAALFLLYQMAINRSPGLSRYEIRDASIPRGFDGYRILQISDLHAKDFGGGNQTILDLVREASPDLVLLTGDLVSRDGQNCEVAFALCRKLSAQYPVYYVTGNHEQGFTPMDLEKFLQEIENCGVKPLQNETAILEREGGSIHLSGFAADISHYLDRQKAPPDAEALRTHLDGAGDGYQILLAHNPLWAKAYADWGADLVFSGHVHGGIIRLPFLGGILSPERRFFPKYSAGVYDLSGCKLVVSRGIGGSILDLRVFNPPDIVLVTLNREEPIE